MFMEPKDPNQGPRPVSYLPNGQFCPTLSITVGTWLSNSIIGLDKEGYGTLLGEAIFTCAKVSPSFNPKDQDSS